jgi:alpha-amylase
MDTPIHPDFTPLAYALVLFRKAGYPCVFYGDLYGISEPFLSPPSCSGRLADLLLARKLYSHGEQVDYFSDANCIGWVRKGLSRSEGLQFDGMAVMMAWAEDETKAQCPKQVFVRRPGWLRRVSSMTGRLSKIQKNELPYRKRMNVGAQHGGEVWTDILEGSSQKAAITHSGWGTFSCQRNSVAIYVSETAEGRMQFPVNFEANL